MLRQLLSLSGSLSARRGASRAVFRTIDFSTNAAAPLEQQTHPNEASAAATARPVYNRRTPRAPAGREGPSAHNASTRGKEHSFAASGKHPKQRPALPPWRFHLKKAASEGNYPACVSILEERLRHGHDVGTSYAFEQVMGALPPHQGLQIYHLAQQHGVALTVGMAVNLIRIYAAMGMLRHIAGSVKDFLDAGVRPHWSIFFHWAAVHAEAGQPEGVTAAATAAEAAGLTVTAHYQTMMVKALCKSGRPGRTLILLREIRETGEVPPEPVWRALVHCHGQAGHAYRAQALFDEMKEAGIVPGLATWTALVNAYAECRMPRQAVDALAAMHAAGIRGNAQTYTVLLKACAYAGDVAAAQAAVEQMRRDGLEPTVHVWGALVAACAAAGDTAAARAAFTSMQESGCPAGVVQYTSLLTAYRHAGDLSGGLQVLKEMDADGVKPSRETFTEVITLLGQHGMITEAEEAFAAMRSQGYAPDQIAFNVLVGALLTNWVDEGREPDSQLLLRAEEVFREGWHLGTTRPPKEASHEGRLMRIDLHCQGTWSAQLAVLSVFADLAVESGAALGDSSGQTRATPPAAPALMLITGHGLKKGWAPLRETVWTMLKKMGMSVRVAVGNGGTLIVPNWDVQRAIRLASRRGWTFDVGSCYKFLVDARQIVGQQDEEDSWGRVDEKMGEDEAGWAKGMALMFGSGRGAEKL